jgi:phosphatidate cytidylyltransferase
VKRVLTAVILIPLVVLALFKAPLWLFTLLVLGVALLAAREYFDIAEATGFKPMRGLSYLALVLLFVALAVPVYDRHDMLTIRDLISISFLIAILFWPWVLFTFAMRREPPSQSLGDAATSLLMLPYIAVSLALIVLIRSRPDGVLFLLFLMLVVWTGDIAAYYVGRAIGKHKLAPRISPGKTWEGAIASIVGSVVVAVLLFHFSPAIISGLTPIGLPHVETGPRAHPPEYINPQLSYSPMIALLFAICVNISAQLGDLFESAIKRGAGLKDSGTLLPGHGGVLDRIDALLFALPVGYFFYTMT